MKTRYRSDGARRSQGGFTLVELLIAIFLLALGLTFVFTLFPVGIYCTRENLADTQAAMLARTALAQISVHRVVDDLDTKQLRTLATDQADTFCALWTGQHGYGDGFGPADVGDTLGTQYCWLATYAWPTLGETTTEASPAGAVRVRVAVFRPGSQDNLVEALELDSDFAGALDFDDGVDTADIIERPANAEGLASGNYVCDLRSGTWYRILQLQDTDDDGSYDRVVLQRAAEHDSNGDASFHNALFLPRVVAVFDAMVSRRGQ